MGIKPDITTLNNQPMMMNADGQMDMMNYYEQCSMYNEQITPMISPPTDQQAMGEINVGMMGECCGYK